MAKDKRPADGDAKIAAKKTRKTSTKVAYYLPPDSPDDRNTPYYIPPDSPDDRNTPYYIPPDSPDDRTTPYYIPPDSPDDRTTPYYIPPDSPDDRNTPYYIPPDSPDDRTTPYYIPPDDRNTCSTGGNMSSKGSVLGRLKFTDTNNGDMIDCTSLGIRGKSIPLDVDSFIASTDISSDATFILFVEKSMVKVPFYNQYSCIIVTTKGPPDDATKLFLAKISRKLNLPVAAFLDCIPRCFKILGDLINLDIPQLIWLGFTPSYVRTNPKYSRSMKSGDFSKCMDLLNECRFPEKYALGFADQLRLMVKDKRTLKLDALPYQKLIDVDLRAKLNAYGLL